MYNIYTQIYIIYIIYKKFNVGDGELLLYNL